MSFFRFKTFVKTFDFYVQLEKKKNLEIFLFGYSTRALEIELKCVKIFIFKNYSGVFVDLRNLRVKTTPSNFHGR